MEKLDAEKYISSNEYKKFCEANKCELDDNLVNKHNENFIKRKLVEYKEYFDHIFIDAGENIKLDEEQRRIILRDDDYCLINAGAGSGKSKILSRQVEY